MDCPGTGPGLWYYKSSASCTGTSFRSDGTPVQDPWGSVSRLPISSIGAGGWKGFFSFVVIISCKFLTA